jgi:hypothetical protein
MTDLITEAFELQRKIESELPHGWELIDTGMFLPDPDTNVIERDLTIEVEGKEYSMSFNTNGELHGDVPPQSLLKIKTILEGYKRLDEKEVVINTGGGMR